MEATFEDLLNLPDSPISELPSPHHTLQGSPEAGPEASSTTGRARRSRAQKRKAQDDDDEEEDWTKVQDMAERRKIQNRNAQRTYRKKRKQPKNTAASLPTEQEPRSETMHRTLSQPTAATPGPVQAHVDTPVAGQRDEAVEASLDELPNTEDFMFDAGFFSSNDLNLLDLDFVQTGGTINSVPEHNAGPADHEGQPSAVRVAPRSQQSQQTKVRSALRLALQNGHYSTAKVLLKNSPALVVTPKGEASILQQLRDAGQHELLSDLCTAQTADDCTVMHLLAASGSTADIDILLGGTVDLEATDSEGKTALHVAAANGHTDAVRLLASKGANIKALVRPRNNSGA
ncbi:ankyrin repeat-containing domain protein [Elsinoe ampelina]|uniref:Ankyrin repeat-containing domain protein n=1 Tax=Elsinoe ampelina TaxID=302913 RepID=A0A6A6GKC9_9PEZI|nr:ankyrin repeat-containing domain protein [Elsinoe ampelina]